MIDKPLLHFDINDGDEVRALLREHNVKYISLAALSFSFRDMVELVEKLATPAAWTALSAVLVSWLRRDKKRSVKLTLEGGKIKTLDIEGFDTKDVERILSKVSAVEFIPSDKK